MPTPQERFDAAYVSSTELMRELGVSRTALLKARERGLLPEAIVVNAGQLLVWEREPLKPFLEGWRLVLRARRGELPRQGAIRA